MSRGRAIVAGLLALLAAAAWAQDAGDEPRLGADGPTTVPAGVAPPDGRGVRIVPAERDLALVLDRDRARVVTDLTLDEIDRILDLRSVARQQHDFVARAVARSLLVPGIGHYTAGAPREAIVFAAAAAAADLATLAATYWLLPPAVQHRNLNYLQSSFEVIESRWKSVSPSQLIPAAAATLTGGLLSLTVRVLAARGAEAAALDALEVGRVRFEPLPLGGVAR